MYTLKMKRDDLPRFLNNLTNFGELWAPVKGDKIWNDERFKAYKDLNILRKEPEGDPARWHYSKIDDPLDLNLDFHSETKRTVIPPKQFMHPPQFSMFEFSNGEFKDNLDRIPQRVVFGPHPCDIHGILILDEFFTRDYIDPYYSKRRENTLLIGTSCLPDENCLAKFTGTHTIEKGFDLFFTDLEDFFLVRVGTDKGNDVVNDNLDLFDREVTKSDLEKFTKWRKWRDSQYKEQVDLSGMPEVVDLNRDSEVWEMIGGKCLACSVCTMVCPTCNCYNSVDEVDLSENMEGSRKRYWDACTLREYSLVAGGENFRETRADRLKLWYTHKLKAYLSERGNYACVGCGRCVASCPVDINVLTVAKGLLNEPVEAFWSRGGVR